MAWDTVWSEPDMFGLKIVGVVQREPCYDFNMCVVWKHKGGKHYFGFDSGCSCPSPFEDVDSIDKLSRLHRRNFKKFETEVRGWGECQNVPAVEVETFLNKAYMSVHVRPVKTLQDELDRMIVL